MKLKKKEGSIHKFAIPLLTLIAVFIIMMVYINYSADLNKKDKIDIIAREYLLRIETEGYLTSGDETQLLNDLQAIGVENVSLIGTTLTKVGYGNKISLVINGQLAVNNYTVNNLLSITKGTTKLNIAIDKSSTAKY